MKWPVAVLMILTVPLAAQVAGRPTRPKVQRPDGAVWEVVRKNCVACHGIDDYAFHAQDRAGWQKLIADKHKSGDAELSEKDRNILLDWLAAKFGPWRATLVDMRERGAQLSDEELERLVEWLTRVWGTNQGK